MLGEEILIDDDPVIFKGGVLQIIDYEEDSEVGGNSKGENDKNNLLIPWAGEDTKSYFSSRNGLMEHAIDEIKHSLAIQEDALVGVWLLTEITFWDNEKERIVLVTKDELIVAKYDFIALKFLDHYKVQLKDVDTLAIGDLVYPSGSLAPRLIGFASGVTNVVKNCALKIVSSEFSRDTDIFNTSYFKSRSRNMIGVRLMWNKGEPLKFATKWNPFTNSIPWSTLASHPLLWHKDNSEEEQKTYNVESFASGIIKAVQQTNRSSMCHINQQPILLQNYFGVLSVLHNRTSLGFFKVRGKFSF